MGFEREEGSDGPSEVKVLAVVDTRATLLVPIRVGRDVLVRGERVGATRKDGSAVE